jgi:integrase
MAKRLSEMTVGRVTPSKTGRLELADSLLPGLSLRVTPDGRRTFALRYRRAADGKQRRLTIGRYDPEGLNLTTARARAREALKLVDAGQDPAAAKASRRDECPEPDRGTVAKIVAKFVERKVKPKARRWRDVEAMLRRDIVRRWGHRQIASITERDMLDLLEEIEKRGSPVVANRNVRLLRRLFAWAVKAKYIETSPATELEKPHDEKPRQRALSDDEIRLVWAAFIAIGYPFGVLGRLLLMLGQRRGETAAMAWSQLDLDQGVWGLPATITKTEVEHILPLVPAVVDLLRTVPRIDGHDLLFPANRAGSANPVSGFSKALATARRLSGVPDFTWHDLRRTVRTNLARLGIPQHVGERILCHADGGENAISRTYNVYKYEPEMRQALTIWAADLERIVAGEPPKVVALRA